MFGGEFFQYLFTFGGQFDVNLAVGLGVLGATQILLFLQTIHETHGTVVNQLQALGQFADRNVVAFGKAFDGEKGLVLLRRQTGGMRDLFAEPKELAKRISKSGKHFVIAPGDLGFHSHVLV